MGGYSLHKCRMLCGSLSRTRPSQLSVINDRFVMSNCSVVGSCSSRIGLFDVSQPSIAQGRKSIAEIIDCGRNSRAFVLTHVICDAKIIANLKQKRRPMKIYAIMKISTIAIIYVYDHIFIYNGNMLYVICNRFVSFDLFDMY